MPHEVFSVSVQVNPLAKLHAVGAEYWSQKMVWPFLPQLSREFYLQGLGSIGLGKQFAPGMGVCFWADTSVPPLAQRIAAQSDENTTTGRKQEDERIAYLLE